MARRGWWLVIAAASVLALVSLASNVTTLSQLEGKANTLLAGRLTLSQLVNAGAVWAGLAVVSGWLVRRPVPAVAAGVVALLTACVVHYGVGIAFGMFDPDVWAANEHWFLAAMVVGGPLGLMGGIARRLDLRGMAARLVVPAGAVLEPLVLGRFTTPAILPWPNRVADFVSGSVLLTAGVAGCVQVIAGERRRRQALPDRRVPAEP
ncbi:hypothetical protein [Actinoplanes solisilvae]|uniref:hypothetical protein n=1 Tax=Actinoplanes solisilvae TaxID=2486853 RepID=UPI000FDB6BA6|nr:hypothetical protein [Actinoplanes solisilvae]